MKKAGEESIQIPYIKNLGKGYVYETKIDLFNNMTVRNDKEIYGLMTGSIKRAKGTYKKRIRDSFNIFFWLEFILFLPQNFLHAILGSRDKQIPSWLIQSFNTIYLVVCFLAAIATIFSYFKQ